MTMKNKYCVIFDEPQPISVFGDWQLMAGSYDSVLGYSLFGDLFLMNNATGQTSILYVMPPELVDMQFFGIESFLHDCISHEVIKEDVLCEDKVDRVRANIGELGEGQIYIPEPYPFLGGDLSVESYSKGGLFTFLSLIGNLQLKQ